MSAADPVPGLAASGPAAPRPSQPLDAPLDSHRPTKVIVRRLPPTLTEVMFEHETREWLDLTLWWRFELGAGSGPTVGLGAGGLGGLGSASGAACPRRAAAYLDFIDPDDAARFIAMYNGKTFGVPRGFGTQPSGTLGFLRPGSPGAASAEHPVHYACVAQFAPYQAGPDAIALTAPPDPLEGTFVSDPQWKATMALRSGRPIEAALAIADSVGGGASGGDGAPDGSSLSRDPGSPSASPLGSSSGDAEVDPWDFSLDLLRAERARAERRDRRTARLRALSEERAAKDRARDEERRARARAGREQKLEARHAKSKEAKLKLKESKRLRTLEVKGVRRRAETGRADGDGGWESAEGGAVAGDGGSPGDRGASDGRAPGREGVGGRRGAISATSSAHEQPGRRTVTIERRSKKDLERKGAVVVMPKTVVRGGRQPRRAAESLEAGGAGAGASASRPVLTKKEKYDLKMQRRAERKALKTEEERRLAEGLEAKRAGQDQSGSSRKQRSKDGGGEGAEGTSGSVENARESDGVFAAEPVGAFVVASVNEGLPAAPAFPSVDLEPSATLSSAVPATAAASSAVPATAAASSADPATAAASSAVPATAAASSAVPATAAASSAVPATAAASSADPATAAASSADPATAAASRSSIAPRPLAAASPAAVSQAPAVPSSPLPSDPMAGMTLDERRAYIKRAKYEKWQAKVRERRAEARAEEKAARAEARAEEKAARAEARAEEKAARAEARAEEKAARAEARAEEKAARAEARAAAKSARLATGDHPKTTLKAKRKADKALQRGVKEGVGGGATARLRAPPAIHGAVPVASEGRTIAMLRREVASTEGDASIGGEKTPDAVGGVGVGSSAPPPTASSPRAPPLVVSEQSAAPAPHSAGADRIVSVASSHPAAFSSTSPPSPAATSTPSPLPPAAAALPPTSPLAPAATATVSSDICAELFVPEKARTSSERKPTSDTLHAAGAFAACSSPTATPQEAAKEMADSPVSLPPAAAFSSRPESASTAVPLSGKKVLPAKGDRPRAKKTFPAKPGKSLAGSKSGPTKSYKTSKAAEKLESALLRESSGDSPDGPQDSAAAPAPRAGKKQLVPKAKSLKPHPKQAGARSSLNGPNAPTAEASTASLLPAARTDRSILVVPRRVGKSTRREPPASAGKGPGASLPTLAPVAGQLPPRFPAEKPILLRKNAPNAEQESGGAGPGKETNA